jgi:aryl-phospho-beta-D-glucosidase BglC (GH1 family)
MVTVLVVAHVACGGGGADTTSGAGDDGGAAPTADGAGASSSGGGSPSDGGRPDGGSTSDAGASDTGSSDAPSAGTGLRVVMGSGGAPGHIVDGTGHAVQLHGADRAGSEWSCLYGSFFGGPTDQASVDAMKSWHINAVRLPLNEDCWLGINGVPSDYSGAKYQAAIKTYVDLLTSNGLYVILDLHWAAPGSEQANGQLGMADADHAPTFWSQVAKAYAGKNASVLFDLFNEPFVTDWACWLKGGACAKDYNGATYTATGMAALLKAVRTAGADNVVILGGLGYASDFSQWVAEVSSIPSLATPLDGVSISNVAASWHTYSDQSLQTQCPTQFNGYDPNLKCASGADTAKNYGIPAVLSAGFPVVIGEIGIGVYASSTSPYSTTQAQYLATWLDGMLTWMDQQNQGYVGWDWNTVAPPLLISAFDGTPTPYFGETYKAHVSKL